MILKILGLSLISSIAFADAQKFPLTAQERVKVSFSRALVTVTPSREQMLTVQLSAGCLELVRETAEGELILRENDLLKPRGESQACQVQISAPAGTPLQVHVLDGSITASKLSSDLLLHVQKGKLNLKDSSGTAFLHAQKGDVQVSGYQGRLRFDLQQASATIRDFQGDLDLLALGGDHVLEKPKGNLRVMQSQGTFKVIGGQGSMQLETVRSTLSTQGFAGRIEGQTQEGTLVLNLAAEPDVNLKTQTGKITLNVPSGSGVPVNIVTQEGELLGPPTLPVLKEGKTKILRGRLKGEAGRGSIIVRAQEGSIVLR